MIRVILNNVDITNQTEIDFSYVEKLDRELDEGFIVIAHTKEPNQYPMFSTVSIFENNILLFSGRISNDIVELSSYDSDIYNHNVSLIEHTKLLEKFFVRGKKFSQPLDPNAQRYTLYDVVDILRKTVKFEKTGQEQINAPYNIPQETRDKLENIIAPELTFKDVTLRQALDTVGDYINSISRLKLNGDLVFDNFNELLSEVDIITENYKKQQNIQNYQTIMTSDLINPVNNRDATKSLSYEYYPAKDLWTTLRSGFGLFDFESSVIPTHKPIYEILEVLNPINLIVVESDSETPEGANTTELMNEDMFELDISASVVEENLYATLEDREPLNYTDLTKRNSIIYQYGSKGIKTGLTYGLFDISTNYDLVVETATKKYLLENNIIPSDAVESTAPTSFDYGYEKNGTYYWVNYDIPGGLIPSLTDKKWEALFRVKYIPIPPSVRYEVVRDDITEVNIETYGTSNQKLRIIDLQSFANNMKGRVNQLSESQLTLSHKVSSINDSYKVGDFTADKFVITKKEVIVQRDHYIINYELNKNFNKISQFVGIDQEIRQWEIGESGRTLDRDLNYNEFIEVYATNNELGASGDTTLLGESLFLSTFDENYSGEGLSYAIFSSPQVLDEENNELQINLPLYRINGGNAFGFYTDFETNGSAGNYLDEGDEGFFDYVFERRYNAPLKYTDELGRFETMFITAHNNSLSIQEGTFEQEIEFANLLPEFTKTPGGTVISSNFYVSKDAQERLKLTLLYHLLSKNIDEVIIGEKLANHNTLFINTPNTIKIRVWNSDKTFITRDKNVSHTNQDVIYNGDSLIINDTYNYIEVDEDLSNAVAWAITDENGFPFLMVNGNKKRLVFEFNNKRSGIQYKLFAPQLSFNFEESFKFTDEISFTKRKFLNRSVLDGFTMGVSPIIYTDKEFLFIEVDSVLDSFSLGSGNVIVTPTYQQLIAPIVTFSSVTENTANMNIFNSNNIPVSFYYRRISPNVTSFQSLDILDDSNKNIILSGLSGGTNYVYESYFESESNSSVISSTVQDNFTTTAVPTYDITFNANNGTWNDGTTTNKIITGEEGDIIYQPPQSISRTGFLLTGWNPSLPYVIGNSDDTITAQWAVDNNTYVVRARKFTGANPIVIIEVEPNAVYGGSTFTGFLNDTYQVIDDDIPKSTPYTLSLQAPQSFTEGGINYTFTGWVVNDTTYNNNNVTISDIEEDADITIQYLGFG